MVARALFALCLLASTSVYAAGFFRPGIGVGNLGAGGTGVSGGLAGYGHWYNPAMLGLIQGGTELTLDWTGLDEDFTFKRSREGLLPVERQQQDTDAGGYYSDRIRDNCCVKEPSDGEVDQAELRQIPFVGVAFPARDDLVLGLAVYGPQGPRREMNPEGSQRYGVVRTNITLAIAEVSAAYHRKNWGLGLGLANYMLTVGQTFTLSGDFEGTENPEYDAHAAVQVKDQAIPVAIGGFWYNPLPGLRIGASWSRPMKEKCTGSGADQVCGHVVAEGTIEPTLAAGLAALAEVTQNDGGALVMRFPDMIRLGATQKVGSDLEVSVEGFYEAWGSIGDLTFVPHNVVFTAVGEEIALQNIVFPRDWDDTYGVRLGSRYELPKTATKIPVQARLGAQWESSATPSSSIDPGALDWEKLGLSIGFGAEVMPGLSVDAFYLRTLTTTLDISNSTQRTTNIFHADEVAAGNPGLATVSGNGTYIIAHQRFGVGLRYALGAN